MTDVVSINVGGTIFMTNLSTLQRYPETRLGSLTQSSEFYNKEKRYYFFDRNPEFFNTILDYYRNGQIHFPSNICGWVWKQEIEFWQISASKISECCFPSYIKYKRDCEMANKIKAAFHVQTLTTHESIGFCGFRQRMWLFLDEPTSSVPARIYSFLYLFIVLLSTVVSMAINYPDVRTEFMDVETFVVYFKMQGIPLPVNVDNPKEVMYFTTKAPSWLRNTDKIITVFFSLDLIIRVIVCPNKLQFVKNFLNILDFILFISMWWRFIIEFLDGAILQNDHLFIFSAICYCLVVFRLLRFFRITKQYSGLRILLLSVRESFKELGLLSITFFVFVLLFSNIIYFAELREPTTFPDMMIGLWWAVVTMTTVGYGDVVPKTAFGRIVGSLCAICGLLLLAMPIAVIAGKFNNLYDKNADIEDFNKLHKQNDTKGKCQISYPRSKEDKIMQVTPTRIELNVSPV